MGWDGLGWLGWLSWDGLGWLMSLGFWVKFGFGVRMEGGKP